MRKFGAAVVLLLVVSLSACSCAIEKRTVDRLDASLTKQHVKYLKYVEADASLIEAQKQIERDNVASQKNLLKELKEATDE